MRRRTASTCFVFSVITVRYHVAKAVATVPRATLCERLAMFVRSPARRETRSAASQRRTSTAAPCRSHAIHALDRLFPATRCARERHAVRRAARAVLMRSAERHRTHAPRSCVSTSQRFASLATTASFSRRALSVARHVAKPRFSARTAHDATRRRSSVAPRASARSFRNAARVTRRETPRTIEWVAVSRKTASPAPLAATRRHSPKRHARVRRSA
mmetsp:Transcript_3177/g.12146  ORF Transcript_3177/g.12146 Transcript_3177/m.12146 type:complete len:216 (-) Transcript_3177:78-725(-)